MLSLDVHSYSVPVKLAHCYKIQFTQGRDAAQDLRPAAFTAKHVGFFSASGLATQ